MVLSGQIDYDDGAKQLVGEVVNSIDLIEFSGESATDIKANFQKCIDEYLTFHNEYVGENPVPFVGKLYSLLDNRKAK